MYMTHGVLDTNGIGFTKSLIPSSLRFPSKHLKASNWAPWHPQATRGGPSPKLPPFICRVTSHPKTATPARWCRIAIQLCPCPVASSRFQRPKTQHPKVVVIPPKSSSWESFLLDAEIEWNEHLTKSWVFRPLRSKEELIQPRNHTKLL